MAKVSNPGRAAKMAGKKAAPKKAAAAGMNKAKAATRYPSTAGSMVQGKTSAGPGAGSATKTSGTKGATLSARQAKQQSVMQGRTSGRKIANPQGGNF